MKKFLSTLTIAFWSLTLVASAASAASLTAQEQAALTARIASFEQSFQAGDLSEMGEIIPPKVLGVMSEQFGIPVPQLLEAMTSAMQQAMQDVTINSYAMNRAAAITAETSSGRTYLLIPTETVMTVQGTTQIQSKNHTLAFADEGAWYLVRIDDAQQVQFLTRAYPEFAGIDFPSGTTTVLNE